MLQTPSCLDSDPELKELYTTAEPADFIVAILNEVSDLKCSNERMQDVVSFITLKYHALGESFDFAQLTVKTPELLGEFFNLYATIVAHGNEKFLWDLNLLKHVVHLDLIKIFVTATNDRFVPDHDDKKFTNLLKHCTAQNVENSRKGNYSKIMCAIQNKYSDISEEILRYIIKRPNHFCNSNMF